MLPLEDSWKLELVKKDGKTPKRMKAKRNLGQMVKARSNLTLRPRIQQPASTTILPLLLVPHDFKLCQYV